MDVVRVLAAINMSRLTPAEVQRITSNLNVVLNNDLQGVVQLSCVRGLAVITAVDVVSALEVKVA